MGAYRVSLGGNILVECGDLKVAERFVRQRLAVDRVAFIGFCRDERHVVRLAYRRTNAGIVREGFKTLPLKRGWWGPRDVAIRDVRIVKIEDINSA